MVHLFYPIIITGLKDVESKKTERAELCLLVTIHHSVYGSF